MTEQCLPGSAPYDSTQEMRAMILAALPYPPLPVQLRRLEEGNVLGGEVLQTTHDIISVLLQHACAKNSVSENRARLGKQRAALQTLLQALAEKGMQAIPDLYRTYCDHTLLHIAAYLGDGTTLPEMRFLPLESVCKGDACHLRMCDYMAGQARLLQLDEGFAAQDWLCYEYAHMLTVARSRLMEEVESPAAAAAAATAAAGDDV